ncbi:ComEA family DNA-binding protein [Luteimonas sp. FCS-9]|uniref:ComEA family DNA-binding protein n=1 Tax=Luteimonas sp. FCS-9 TaxID=1547516 RepID=UPI00063EB25E|nr:ComEA family DNA-binding protein [Luteimonas sp. FCS-9]KLJ01026.1 competence protein ComEA [Luteimonas sp. FCS-9]
MKPFKAVIASLVLSLLMAGSAFAADGGEKVNVNTADATTLARVLHNVGPSKAEAIVAYRDENGPFRSAEQLAMVKGIGLRTVENNRDRIELGSATARQQPTAQRASATPAKGAVQQR